LSGQIFDYDMTLRTYLAAADRPAISSQYAKLYGPRPLSTEDHASNLIRFIALHRSKSEMTFQLSPAVAQVVDVSDLAARSGTTIEARTDARAGMRNDETLTFLRVQYGATPAIPSAEAPASNRPPGGFGDLGRALGGLAATAGKAIEAAAVDVGGRIDDGNIETEIREVAKEVERGVSGATAFVGSQIAAATVPEPVAPIARPTRAGPDPRVPIALRAAGMPFAAREGGGFVVSRTLAEHEVIIFIASHTSVGGRLEVRSVWSEAPRKKGPLSAELADRILQLGAASSFGAWVARAEPDGGRQAAFVAKIPADLDSESLAAVIDHVAAEAVKVR